MVYLSNLNEHFLTGVLTKLSDNETVSVKYMEFDKPSEQKLLTVLNTKRFTGENVQNLFIKNLYINAADADKFCKGQSLWIQNGDTYLL